MPAFLDTNILLYSVSVVPHEAAKRRIAQDLIESEDFKLSAQVLQEFYYQATRVGAASRLIHEDAAGLVLAWSRFHVEPVTSQLVRRALQICEEHRINYWDAAIVSAAEAAGATTLMTEDLNHGQTIAGVLVQNPFLAAVRK